MLRRISGYRFFTFAKDEARAYCEAARALGISSVSLAEYAGDCFVVHVMLLLTMEEGYFEEVSRSRTVMGSMPIASSTRASPYAVQKPEAHGVVRDARARRDGRAHLSQPLSQRVHDDQQR